MSMHDREDGRARFRASLMAKVPGRYTPVLHLGVTIAFCLTMASLALWRIDGLRAIELWTVPASLAFANFFEWWFHRRLMHRRRPWADIYRRHTLEHHRLYRWGDMGIRERRELYYVLMPTSTIAGFMVLSILLSLGPGLLFGPNVGWLVMLCLTLYVLTYELSHLSYHLPDGHPVKRVALVRRLAEHHSRHHEPKLMQFWNFNITLPLADLVLGTIAPRELVERVRSSRNGEPPAGGPDH